MDCVTTAAHLLDGAGGQVSVCDGRPIGAEASDA